MTTWMGKKTTWTRRCKCGRKVTVTGYCGPVNICDPCAGALLAVIWGGRENIPRLP